MRFIAETPERTRVELEHRNLDRHGDGWENVRDAVGSPGGWPGGLERFARVRAGAVKFVLLYESAEDIETKAPRTFPPISSGSRPFTPEATRVVGRSRIRAQGSRASSRLVRARRSSSRASSYSNGVVRGYEIRGWNEMFSGD